MIWKGTPPWRRMARRVALESSLGPSPRCCRSAVRVRSLAASRATSLRSRACSDWLRPRNGRSSRSAGSSTGRGAAFQLAAQELPELLGQRFQRHTQQVHVFGRQFTGGAEQGRGAGPEILGEQPVEYGLVGMLFDQPPSPPPP